MCDVNFPHLFPNPELKVAPPFNPETFLIIQLTTIEPPIHSKAHQNINSYPYITRTQSQWSKQVSSSSKPKPPPPTAGTTGLSKFEQVGAPVAIYHYLSRRCKHMNGLHLLSIHYTHNTRLSTHHPPPPYPPPLQPPISLSTPPQSITEPIANAPPHNSRSPPR